MGYSTGPPSASRAARPSLARREQRWRPRSMMNHEDDRILVVDDESLNRVLLSTSLEEAGYIVETAEDGQRALEMLRVRPYDVVLLDLIMPKMDGYRVLAEMKQDAALRRTPVIVISS